MKKRPRELEAVLTIMSASPDLDKKVRRHIDPHHGNIRFKEILSMPLSTGELAAMRFAGAIWFGTDATVGDTFQHSREMDRRTKLAVIRALKIYWELV